MYQIVEKEVLVPNIIYLKIKAPKVAKAARPGQFVIIRVDETGERIPMGLAGWDVEEGTIDIVFYVLGTSTMKLGTLREGDSIMNLAGPLGKPTEIDNFGTVICACGCFGIGPSMPLIKALKEAGNYVITIVEGRSREFIFWEEKLRAESDELHILAGSGGCGEEGWTNDFVSRYLEGGKKVDRIFAHGCPFMMMETSKASEPYGVKTIVSLTPLMVDGTGMCGACRVEVGGVTKFACVDGPDFDGHEVNWDTLTLRLRQFIPEEDRSAMLWERDNWHRLVETAPQALNPTLGRGEGKEKKKAVSSS
ncbi:MAG: sulfide/dihydroorotate dehydrogenase-like FAD/NAD-binding protein [Methanothrix sp.]|jgi:ferredoxin--NADP+ reductase|uniref:Sulfide dehydrogenase (Flavoprotein) subunit SudB n=1 Tax=Methanothrix harundinacea TaxID=301375 RepID=A0A124FME9_9EURY|nr:MAG: ferredoxin-NADP reductase [Methanosaeta sp. SDB]KUK44516.1 MAG: Sulfide dehydrogenase (Flavoprotein) subunit SudB [Methanothrix harundinacea]MDD2637882.1 sulfide/dihydroorotate dehydrogenase-like FAD/NAD-binding protein [Methanothrix sp.]MDI9398959.1 sulfide/dihydroorotate dehydrogenase-like FAD/NAD-binding protein [Euryarchaeota archaeon]KUK95632.1 MAG: Sulfide dehydrogenase (Flavoprotein) subunit SudB [Methanothrix harundinacea]